MARLLKTRLQTATDQLEELLSHDHPAATQQMNIGELTLRIHLIDDDLDKISKVVGEIKGISAEWTQIISKMPQKDQDAAINDYDNHVALLQVADKVKNSGTRARQFKTSQISLASAKTTLETAQLQQQNAGGAPAAQATGAQTTGRVQYQVEIAKIRPQIFSGGKSEWQSWWPVYNLAIHTDPAKPRFLKMADLMSLLKGEAKDIVYGLQLTDADYDLAIKALTEKYDDNSHMVRELHRQLISLKASQSFEDDRKLLIDVQRITRMLKNNAQDINAPTIWLTLEQKVTKPVLRQIQEAKAKAGVDWDTEKFLSSFKDLVIAEEAIEEIYNQSHQRREIGKKPKMVERAPFKKFQTTIQTTVEQKAKIAPKLGTFGQQKKGVKRPQRDDKSKATPSCRLCSQSHWTSGCSRFRDAKSREEKAKELKLCLKCLGINHSSNECTAKIRNCWYCNKWGHNRVFCPQQFGMRKQFPPMVQHASIQQFNGTAKESNSSTKRTASEMDTRAQHKLLLTKKVTVYNPENPKLSKKVLVFFDSGSERSYVEKALASFLKLEAKNPAEITLTGFAGVDLGTYTMHMTKLCMKTAMGEKTIEPEITTRVLREMAHVEFADLYDSDFEATQLQSPTESLQPLVLIGTDYFADFDIKTEKRLPSGFWVANSKVGRLILGKGNLSKPKMAKKVTSTAISQEAVEVQLQNDDDGLNSMVKKFFDLEAAGMADAAHPTENEQWLDHFNKELHFNMEEKRYEVALPWNNRAEELQPNYGLARGRLDNNLKKLDKEKFQLYDQIIQEQLSKGIVEMVPDPKAWTGKLHYLPHQAVIKDDHQTTKLRIVYDGSAHTKDTPSLNQCLDKGPQLLNDLIGIVMRCRMSEILICADIEKAFLQILIKEEDRDALRFLWVNTDGQVRTYRFRRVPFGLISSPAHLSVTLKHHLGQTDHTMAKDIAQNLYVDNILLCTDSSKDIAKVCHEMRKIFQKASMNLREFGANHRGIMDLPDDWLTNPHRMKILGIKWNPFKDQLEFHLPRFQAARATKRTILSHLASVFDPLGLLSPIILPGKILLSKLWHEKYGWDDELSEQLSSEWANTIQDWPTVCFKMPRMATVPSPREKAIHIFADASGKAMGVCAYLRSKNEEATKTMLLFAKSLVVPTKTPERQNTIPRLELQALKIATSVAEKLQKELPEVTKIILWTDSRDALEWAKSGKKQDRYVENRLNKIRRYMVRFVAGTSNPADIASRGAKATELLDNNLWQFGPNWLTLKEEEWPMDQIIFDPEVERHTGTDELPIMEMTLPTMEHPPQKALIDETRFSRKKAEPKKGNLKEKLEAIPPANADELLKAEQILIKNAQQRHPAEPQLVQNLQLYEDESGILRSKGRIQKGDIAESAKDPIFLPHKAELTALIIRHVHNKLHAGANNVLAEIRQNFWVPQARRTIRHVLQNGRSRHFCHTCHKFKTKPFGQVTMPPLPQFRVDGHTSRPFLNIGLDYFGPMLTKSNGKEMKVWGCIFTCAVTRGIHIELVNDLTAEAFLNALSRFCARRKVPKLIVSDNAKTFKLGSKAAQQIWQTTNAAQLFNQPTVQKSVADKGIKWRFNTERAPWTGGFFEKMVHLVKEPLRKTLGKKLVDYEQLMTTLIEVEKIINDRPLTYISEAEQTTILRPIDFISPYLDNEIQEIWSGEDLDPKDPDFIANPTSKQSLIAKFKVARQNADKFWEIWRKEYLTALREKQKSTRQGQRVPEIGEIVIIHDESPRNKWKLGKVVKLIPSDDGLVRSAIVWTQKTELKRPVTKLYPLEIKEQINTNANLGTNEEANPNNDSSNHQISGMDDFIELDYDDMYGPEEVGQTGPRHEPNGGESHQGEGDGPRLRVQRHHPNGGESHQGDGDGQRHRQRSNGGESLRVNAFERRQRNRSSQNRAPQQQRAPARHEQGRATRRGQRSRSRDDNRAPPPQKDQPRQKFNWAPVPPKPQHAAPPPIMATTRPQPTKGWAPVDGVFHLSKWSMSERCDGTNQHSNCSPVMASYLSDGLAQIYIPTLLHLLLAQILLDYSERWDAISNAIYTLTTSGLSPAELIQAAIAQKPLIGYGYTMGKKWTRGVPNPAKWQRMRARGSPQDLWWRFSDATTAVNIWNHHCRVAQAETEIAAQMEAAVEIEEVACAEDHPAFEKLIKMREDIQTALQLLAQEGKKIITSKFVVIAEETTEALGYAINAFVTNCEDFSHSVLSGVNEAVILWTGSEAIRRGMPWANYIVKLSPIVEKLIKLDKRFVWICPPRMAQHTTTWLEYEDGFCSLAMSECGKGEVLVMPFTDSDVSDQGFLTGSGVFKTMDELERILRGKKEERPSLDARLQRFVEARAHQANEVNTNELNVNTSEPMVVVAACTSAVQHPIEHQEEIQIAMPQAEEVPWTWGTKRYFVNDVKISATKMRELDEALEALILSQVPPPEERELKQNTFDAVRRILRRDTWEEFEICVAGSTRANTDLRSGDLDIVLMPKSGEPLSHERKLREIKFLVREFRLMKRQYPYRHCVTITKTKAPLVKIRTSEDVDIDITIDNSEALTNSNWLAEQMNDSKLWRLYMAVKIFAKHNGIGDASCGGLNSLSWAIMTKHFAASRGQERCETPLLDFLQMAEYFSEFPFEGYTITTTGWRERKSSSAPIYVEDPHNSEDNCARNRQAQDVCRVKSRLSHAWRQFIRKKEKCRLADLGFPCSRDEDFGWPSPRVQPSRQEEMDLGEKESDHSDFDPDELVFEVPKEGEPSNERRVARWPENFPRQLHDRSNSPDGAMVYLSPKRGRAKSKLVDSKESEMHKKRAKNSGLKKPSPFYDRRTNSDSKESVAPKKGSLIKKLMTLVMLAALVRPTTQQSAMVCNQAAHPQIMELTNNFQCEQLMATKRNATLEVFKPVKRGVERGNPVVRYERARRATPKSGLEQSLEEATRQLEEFGRVTISTPGGVC
ncbi:hypothetical protein niasHS_010360 [Heterodera schachtii]|uniref:Integrase catalytic domain-containing protein n=1 Tax=Heterodera schachtii TaxID=97005 RepID=A0ABD2J190_HETSC